MLLRRRDAFHQGLIQGLIVKLHVKEPLVPMKEVPQHRGLELTYKLVHLDTFEVVTR
jgi:hypothetical protein